MDALNERDFTGLAAKLRKIVKETIEEEDFLSEKILRTPEAPSTAGERISDNVAVFGGSWKFIIYFMVLLVLWIIFNSIVPKGINFDPYPFILMNLILSCIAALQAPIIMMSQNRKEVKDRKRAENDYLINLKAEIEIRSVNKMLDLLLKEEIPTIKSLQKEHSKLLVALAKKPDAI